MTSPRLFVEPDPNISNLCKISPSVAQEINVSSGQNVSLIDPDSNKQIQCKVEVSDEVLDFSIKVASDILNQMGFDGIELMIQNASGASANTTTGTNLGASTTPNSNLGTTPSRSMPSNISSSPTQTSTPGQMPGMTKPPTPSIPQPPTPSTPQPPTPGQMPGVPQPPTPGQMPGVPQPPTPGQMPGVPQPPTPGQMPGVPQPPTPGQMPGVPQPPTPGQMPGVPQPPTPGQMPGVPQPPTPGQMPGVPQPPTPGQMPGVPQPPGMTPPPGMPQPPGMTPPPGMPQPPGSMTSNFSAQPSMGMNMGAMPAAAPPDPYPNKIDVNILASQKPGSLVLKVVKSGGCEGRVKLNPQTIQQLGLAPGMLVGWECPLTRSTGSARITSANVPPNEIHMDIETAEDTNTKSDMIVVYSTEPPITHQDIITLEVVSQPGLQGLIMLNPRNAATLQVHPGEILAFEDSLTGAMGAAKFQIKEDLGNDQVIIDSELLEASGIGSMEVDLRKNMRQVIPLQSVELGIAPIKGENVWELISMARQNIGSIKAWLSNYIIFKGIKLRWEAVNVACEVLSSVPDLTGDILAQITPNTSLTLKPTGLVTFNAILIIDISRSMMARDVEVKNIGPALEGIKAAMHAKEIQDFLNKFKPGTYVPRRYSAAFGAILFLSEKVGRGFGEKVAIIRFADEAQVLTFQNGQPFMDSSSGEKDVLENAAKMIVEQIGNAYGQATNMGLAMLKAQELLYTFNDNQPTMIVL
ncbi:MAG: hypothetical protein ACTSXF_01475, partial [Promethearchaeota archaeon]